MEDRIEASAQQLPCSWILGKIRASHFLSVVIHDWFDPYSFRENMPCVFTIARSFFVDRRGELTMELAHQRRKKSLELVLVDGLGKVYCNLCHASVLSGFLEGRVYMAVLLLPAKVALIELRTRSS